MAGMMGYLLDRLFGKRYRPGWPRGVCPMFPWLEELKRADPEWWELYRQATPSGGLQAFRNRNPEHPFSKLALG